jgi:uncharacterized protein Yka (UPF0111/DUF47 family)
MEPTDITIEILRGIRQGVEDTNARIDETNKRVDAFRSELKDEISQLSRRVVESEVRTATAITDLHGTLREVRDMLREDLSLRPRLERCENDIDEIRRRLGMV